MYTLRDIGENIKQNNCFTGQVLYNELLAGRTTFNVGGNTPVLIEPDSVSALQQAVSAVKNLSDVDSAHNRKPYFILGGGSNLVISDKGFDIPVISLRLLSDISVSYVSDANRLHPSSVLLQCGAGTSISSLTSFCIRHSITGFEEFAGLPGTVGGALYMNAQCFGKRFDANVHDVSFLDESALYQSLSAASMTGWGYKHSPFTGSDKIIVGAVLRGECYDLNCLNTKSYRNNSLSLKIAENCSAHVFQRISKGHFKYPCAGSIFKNNDAYGKSAGQIIDECGLRGYTIGDARIAPWHGNIIINTGHASADDIHKLAEYVMSSVYQKTGLILELEVIFCGI